DAGAHARHRRGPRAAPGGSTAGEQGHRAHRRRGRDRPGLRTRVRHGGRDGGGGGPRRAHRARGVRRTRCGRHRARRVWLRARGVRVRRRGRRGRRRPRRAGAGHLRPHRRAAQQRGHGDAGEADPGYHGGRVRRGLPREPEERLPDGARGVPGARRRARERDQHGEHGGADRPGRPRRLRGDQGRHDLAHEGDGARLGAARRPRERGVPGQRDDADAPGVARRAPEHGRGGARPGVAPRVGLAARRRRGRRRLRVSGERARAVRDRLHHAGEWRGGAGIPPV
ncbi:MAG: D-beta-hydroxybutyrate dehydrogenase, partial [uncultured Gemmatimonadaceae bacterium]